MPASITTGEPEQIEPDLFVQASKRRHGHDFSQCAPASLLRRACLLAHACAAFATDFSAVGTALRPYRRANRAALLEPERMVSPFTSAMAAKG